MGFKSEQWNDILSKLQTSKSTVAHPKQFEPGSDLSDVLDAPVTFGIPGLSAQTHRQWIGDRLFYWSGGRPQTRLIGLAMSRIGRQPETRQPVFDAIRTAVIRVDNKQETLLVSEGTAAQKYVSRAATLFGRNVLTIRVSSDKTPVEQWLGQIENLESTRAGGSNDSNMVFVSAPIDGPDSNSDSIKSGRKSIPIHDRLLVAMSKRLLTPHLRKNGHSWNLIVERLESDDWPAGSVHVLESEVGAAGTGELIDAGAVGWHLLPAKQPIEQHSRHESPADQCLSEFTAGEYLTHCTRRFDGPWPGESEFHFLDDLLLDRNGADHSALATLLRIVGQQRLVAATGAIRGKTPVVCFSECATDQLVKRRTFRAHRGKWDYEPYGVCIRKDWLKTLGAQKVTYVPADNWGSVADENVWHHQTASTADGKTDWQDEQEWRVKSDVDLSNCPPDCGFVFVPDQQAAITIGSQCRWPVVVLGNQ